MSASSRKPYLLQDVPLVALVESNGTHRHCRVTLSSALAMNQRDVTERKLLRRMLLDRRAALSPGFRQRAALLVTQYVATTGWLRAGANIGLYASMGVELNTRPLRALALRRGCRLFLPRISNFRLRVMRLCPDRGELLQPNRYGIDEPPATTSIGVHAFQAIFVPLLGFDDRGNRLGMGGGYYDRYLASGRPLLVGLAYERSRVPTLPVLPHDIPLDAVVTEAGIHRFHRGHSS